MSRDSGPNKAGEAPKAGRSEVTISIPIVTREEESQSYTYQRGFHNRDTSPWKRKAAATSQPPARRDLKK